MARLVCLALVIGSAGVASAGPRVVAATPAVRGKDAAEAIRATIRPDDTCQPSCASVPVHELALGDAKVIVQRVSGEGALRTHFPIVIESPAGTFAWNGDGRDTGVHLLGVSAGSYQTVTDEVEHVSFERHDGLVWIRFHNVLAISGRSRGWTETATSYQTLVACKVDGVPACAAVAGDGYKATQISASGTLLTLRHTRTDGGADSEQVKLSF